MEFKDYIASGIALLAAIISFVALRRATKASSVANGIALKGHQWDRRQALQKYADILEQKRGTYKPWFSELERKADFAYSAIYNRITDFSPPDGQGHATQDALHEIIELFYRAFERELPSRPTFEIYQRMGELFDLRSRVDSTEHAISDKELSRAFSEKNEFVNEDVWHSTKLKKLVERYSTGLSRPKEAYEFALGASNEVRRMIESRREMLKHDIELLDVAENEVGPDKLSLRDDPYLHASFCMFRQTLQLHEAFSMLEQKMALRNDANCADQVVLIAFTMYLFQRRGSWGNSRLN